jgi:CBS domain containing-hemolysin-like protein
VYKNSRDNIVGVIHTKELLLVWRNKKLFLLNDLMRTPYFISEDIKINDLLKDLRHKRLHMAVVKGTGGDFKGIVTMEDIIEEIVGKIEEEENLGTYRNK